MKAKYIEKTFPITLQDLIDLAKSQNLDPHDLKLVLNDHFPDYTDYVHTSLLNQDGDKISIELYTLPEDCFDEDISLKTHSKKGTKVQPKTVTQ